MEELLIATFQFLFEFVLDVLANLPFDWPSRNRRTPEPDSIISICFIWFFGGCILAGLSLLVLKHTLISVPVLRMANLILAPVTSGFISLTNARYRSRSNPFIVPRNHFWQAFWFTLGIVTLRFTYAGRM